VLLVAVAELSESMLVCVEFLFDRKTGQTPLYRKPVNFLGFYVTVEFKDGLLLGCVSCADLIIHKQER
jgi:hypothetical protein